MNIDNVKDLSFPKSDYEQWRSAAEAVLRGKTVDNLKTPTYEGITLNPLYTDDNVSLTDTENPGEFPYTRGIYANGYHDEPWAVCQPVGGADCREANDNMKSALLRGQNAIVFPAELLVNGEFTELLDGLPLDQLPLYIDARGLQKNLLPQLGKLTNSLSGVLAEDPVAEWCLQGHMPGKPELFFKNWFDTLRELDNYAPQLKSILIKSVTYHNAGASAIQELACVLATAALYIEEGQKNGFTVEDLADKMIFSFAIDSDYFMNIAKLRAARRLWAQFAEAYQADADHFKMVIHAVTSERSETLYDEHVNILRTTNQAFASAIGGIQYLEVHPFNHASSKENQAAERIARNIHLILKEETHITEVTDPAGGSWYIEQLTDEIAVKAWEKFFDIHTSGGILPLLQEGKIQDEINDVFIKREHDLATRKVSIIGTNVYPNPADLGSDKQASKEITSYYTLTDSQSITALKPTRLAEPFEELRQRSAAHRKLRGEAPQIGLLTIGELKNYKPRADFMKALAAAGGIEVVEGSSLEAIDFIKKTSIPTLCLCGSDEDYKIQIVKEIKKELPQIQLYLAGKPKEEVESEFKDAGIRDVIHSKTNAVDMLTEWHKQLGVKA